MERTTKSVMEDIHKQTKNDSYIIILISSIFHRGLLVTDDL